MVYGSNGGTFLLLMINPSLQSASMNGVNSCDVLMVICLATQPSGEIQIEISQ